MKKECSQRRRRRGDPESCSEVASTLKSSLNVKLASKTWTRQASGFSGMKDLEVRMKRPECDCIRSSLPLNPQVNRDQWVKMTGKHPLLPILWREGSKRVEFSWIQKRGSSDLMSRQLVYSLFVHRKKGERNIRKEKKNASNGKISWNQFYLSSFLSNPIEGRD